MSHAGAGPRTPTPIEHISLFGFLLSVLDAVSTRGDRRAGADQLGSLGVVVDVEPDSGSGLLGGAARYEVSSRKSHGKSVSA